MAILNYIGTAGVSFAEEVQSLEELAKNYPFESLHHTGNIRYDVDKLTWFNHKWLNRLDAHALLAWVKPILHAALPASTTCSDDELVRLIAAVKSDLQVLPDIVNALRFVFNPPAITPQQFVETMGEQVASAMQAIIAGRLDASTPQALLDGVKADATARGLKVKEAFSSLRFVLTGATQGVGMQELMTILPAEEIKRRLEQISQSSKRLIHIINQLLSLSKTQPEAMHASQFVELDLVVLVKKTMEDLFSLADLKKIDLGFDGSNEAAFIMGDEQKLYDLIHNLIENGIKYTPQLGKVNVSIKSKDNKICLIVEDTG
ncbi:hypothetical protein EBZ39_11980, partial [bacterium]|nr:hypothetical protein [bacterium]